MPEKRTTKKASPRKTAARRTPVTKSASAAKQERPVPQPPAGPASTATQACPRCGTSKFGPEQRIRAEGNRTVRYSVLVCERGHTFARPRRR